MMKLYAKGRRKEYQIMHDLRDLGYDIVLRSAGSHSPIDVIGIDIKNAEIDFIQCKSDKMSGKQREKLEREWAALNGMFKCSFEVI